MLQPPTCSITQHQPATLGSVMLQPPMPGAAAAQPDQRDSARNAEPGPPMRIPILIVTPATRNCCYRPSRRWPAAAVQHHRLQRQRQTRPATTESERRHIANLEQAELAEGAAANDAGWHMVSAAAENAEELAGNAAEAAAAEAPASPESPVAEAAAAPATEVADTEVAPAAADTEVAPAAPATAAEVLIAAAAPQDLT